jgi:hypothetical protein
LYLKETVVVHSFSLQSMSLRDRGRYSVPDEWARERLTWDSLYKGREKYKRRMEKECWESGMACSPKITAYLKKGRQRKRKVKRVIVIEESSE